MQCLFNQESKDFVLYYNPYCPPPPPPQTLKFEKDESDRIRSNQKISSYIIIPTAHHHHHHHRKLFGVFQGSYQNSVKSVPPLIYHAKSKYALEKRKGRLPSYLGNEGSYQKTVKGVPPQFIMPSLNTQSKNGKVVFHHISATKAHIEKP